MQNNGLEAISNQKRYREEIGEQIREISKQHYEDTKKQNVAKMN